MADSGKKRKHDGSSVAAFKIKGMYNKKGVPIDEPLVDGEDGTLYYYPKKKDGKIGDRIYLTEAEEEDDEDEEDEDNQEDFDAGEAEAEDSEGEPEEDIDDADGEDDDDEDDEEEEPKRGGRKSQSPIKTSAPKKQKTEKGSRSTGRGPNKKGAGRPKKEDAFIVNVIKRFQAVKAAPLNQGKSEEEIFSLFNSWLIVEGLTDDRIVSLHSSIEQALKKTSSTTKPMDEVLVAFSAANKDIKNSYKKMTSVQLEAEIKSIGSVNTSGLLNDLQKKFDEDKKFLNNKKKLAEYYEKNITASSSPEILQLFKFFEEHAAVKAGKETLARVLAGGDTQEMLAENSDEEEEEQGTPKTPKDPIPAPTAAAAGGGKGKSPAAAAAGGSGKK